MKKINLLVVGLFVSGALSAQNINKLIHETNVTRLIRTLSADSLGGRSSLLPGGIDKAAAFIEAEFLKIGLDPPPGATSFRQEFPKERIRRTGTTVTVDGEVIPAENLIVVSNQEKVDWNNNASVREITKEKNFMRLAFGMMEDSTDKLVLVDASHEPLFRRAQGYYNRIRLLDGPPKTGSVVFVLGKTAATSYQVQIAQERERFMMTNLVGMLPGKSPARRKELVVFSGHYDHIGILGQVSGDSIANGADDDASGTTAVIELARYFKKLKSNSRTLVFAAFTAEEIGGYGSRHFSQQLNPDSVVAMFNIEMIGKVSKFGKDAAFITGYERSDFGKILQKNLKGTAFTFHPDPYPDQNLFYRSDNATLARLGVPAHTISTDQIDIDKFYHTVDDELETLDISNITRTIQAIALSARGIVAGRETPTRIDKTKVR
ncbi:MAG: M20/M25/M40 family metallo-hydrolase [Cytophagaceae bacterium]|nr:M20/M25/M40 family metallo-hydrolase [Cytophagaceae bacterium]